MFDKDLPDVVMKHFYKVVNSTNTDYYIATDYPFHKRQLYCKRDTSFIGISYNRYKKSWSVYKNMYTINQQLDKHVFYPITKTDFVYEYNKALVALSNIEFE